MKESPILFTGEMVRAILDEKKTQTRRVLKPQPVSADIAMIERDEYAYGLFTPWNKDNCFISGVAGSTKDGYWRCPYGEPGDLLWVREAWRVGAWCSETNRIAVDYRADGHVRQEWLDVKDEEQFDRLWTQSLGDAKRAGAQWDAGGFCKWEPGKGPTRWRISRFMPHWAARLLLEITDIRCERVRDITEACAHHEGWFFQNHDLEKRYDPVTMDTARQWFAELWNSINEKRGYGWEANPWVWVVTFRLFEVKGKETC